MLLHKICFALLRTNTKQIRRSFMMSSFRAEKALEELKVNPYFEKYSGKIAKLQQTSPEEFLSRIETKEELKQKDKIKTKVEGSQYSKLLQPKEKSCKQRNINEESLDKIMKLDMVREKSGEEITKIWAEYHVQKDCTIAAVIPKSDFETLLNKRDSHPTFIFPLPRSQGYEFIMCQFEGSTVHFTPLLYFQVHKESAPECLTIKHYTEFLEDKQIVLMRGEFDKNVIDAKEALCLANQLQMYYCQNSPDKNRLLETFTTTPDDFKHMDLVHEIEKLSL